MQELKRIVERDKDANEEGADAVDDREWDGLSFEHDDSTWGLASGAKMLELWRLSEQRFQVTSLVVEPSISFVCRYTKLCVRCSSPQVQAAHSGESPFVE